MTRESLTRVPLALVVFASLMTSACLPRGDAPAGRQILADRTAVLAGLVPTSADGVMRVLFYRPGTDADNVNLWVLAVDPNGGPSQEQMLFAGTGNGYDLDSRPEANSGGFRMDSQGRLFLTQVMTYPDAPATEELFRVDPVTGQMDDLGPGFVAFSVGQLLVVNRGAGETVVYAPDGTAISVDPSSFNFAGNTVFYVTAEGALIRIAPDGTPQQLAAGVSTFHPFNAQTLLITRAVPDPDAPQPPPTTDPQAGPPLPPAQVTAALLDTTTLTETPLPDGPSYQYGSQFSPTGRFLVVDQRSQDPTEFSGDSVLVDSLAGTIEALSPEFRQNPQWRPGHDELWASAYPPDPTAPLSDSSLSIKRPGQAVVVIPGVFFSGFNDDGTAWFSRGASFSELATSDLVGIADDPTGARFPAVPTGSTLLDRWTLGDGRLLDDSVVGLDSVDSFYVQVVDPRNGATQRLGELGYLSAVGQTRALGIYHFTFLRGDLTTSDFATGRSTILAAEFAMSAIAEPQGTDPYPPGGRIVYQFRARFESPWDGLWLATVP